MRYLLLLLVVLPSMRADSLSQLLSRLAALKAPVPLTATTSFARLGTASKPLPAGSRPVEVRAHEDAEGLQLLWSQSLIEQFAEEARREVKQADPAKALETGLKEIHATTVWRYFHAAEEIELKLAQATLTTDQETTFEGKPARLLTFAVTPLLNEQGKKYIKELKVTIKLWVSPDYTPLAAEAKSHVRGRAFLVIGFESNDTEEYRFATVQGRLVVTLLHKEGSGSGGGESNSYNQETRLVFSAQG